MPNLLHIAITVVAFIEFCCPVLSQSCGILDALNNTLDPNVTIFTDTFMDNLPVNTTIWEAKTANITAAAAAPDPNVKFILGLRYLTRYVYQTNENTFQFFHNESMIGSPISRTVKFDCIDGTSATYTFRFLIQPSDIEEPEFHFPEYRFNITQDWPANRPINFHSFIISLDDDNDLRNAELQFKIDSDTSPLKLNVASSPLWDVGDPNFTPPAAYRLDLLLNAATPPPGTYSLSLKASSRLISSSVNVIVDVTE